VPVQSCSAPSLLTATRGGTEEEQEQVPKKQMSEEQRSPPRSGSTWPSWRDKVRCSEVKMMLKRSNHIPTFTSTLRPRASRRSGAATETRHLWDDTLHIWVK